VQLNVYDRSSGGGRSSSTHALNAQLDGAAPVGYLKTVYVSVPVNTPPPVWVPTNVNSDHSWVEPGPDDLIIVVIVIVLPAYDVAGVQQTGQQSTGGLTGGNGEISVGHTPSSRSW